jgi:hypothetical protein
MNIVYEFNHRAAISICNGTYKGTYDASDA